MRVEENWLLETEQGKGTQDSSIQQMVEHSVAKQSDSGYTLATT